QDAVVGLDALAGGRETERAQPTESIEIWGQEGSVGHVEVFQMASVRTSIIGRPRRLSLHRRAHPATSRYTLNCDEPDSASATVSAPRRASRPWRSRWFPGRANRVASRRPMPSVAPVIRTVRSGMVLLTRNGGILRIVIRSDS